MVRSRVFAAPAACLLGLAACRLTEPGPDYDQAIDEIRAATGAPNVFHPDTAPAEIAERVAELLQNGLESSEAVEVGLLNNPVLQASFHNVGIARADREQAKLLTNPSLGAALRFPSSGSSDSTEVNVGLFASLFDIWQLPDRKRVAESALQRRILELAQEGALLASEIRVAYIDAISSDRQLLIAEENRASARQVLELTEARVAAAAVTIIDVNLARLDFLATELALRDAELEAGEARRRLITLLGLERTFDNVTLGGLSGDEPPPLRSLDELVTLGLSRRLDVRAAEEGVQQAALEVSKQRGLVMRSVDVGISAEREGDWSVGPAVDIELPIFDQNQAQIARALEALSQREKILVAMRLAATQEVSSALARVEASWDTVRIYRQDILARAAETLTQARESYQLGKTTILPVLEAQRRLLAARSAHVWRLRRATMALSDLERATGTPREALLARQTEEGGQQP